MTQEFVTGFAFVFVLDRVRKNIPIFRSERSCFHYRRPFNCLIRFCPSFNNYLSFQFCYLLALLYYYKKIFLIEYLNSYFSPIIDLFLYHCLVWIFEIIFPPFLFYKPLSVFGQENRKCSSCIYYLLLPLVKFFSSFCSILSHSKSPSSLFIWYVNHSSCYSLDPRPYSLDPIP